MRRSRLLLLLVVSLPLVLSGCLQRVTDDEDPAPPTTAATQYPDPGSGTPQDGDTFSGGFVVDGGLSIPEALAYRGNEIIAVQGFVLSTGETNALCELLAESDPPQCGGESLAIANPEATNDMVLIEAEGVQWANEILEKSPLAIRCLKSAFNAALDGQAGIQELAGNATLLYYMNEEGSEGKQAFLEKRKPEFKKFPWLP